MFAIMPFNAWFFTTLTFLQKKRLTLADARVKLMNEVLSGVRIIKYYAWEVPFEGQVTKRRSMELQVLKQIAYVVACGFTLILLAVPIVQPILVFYTYVQLGYELDAGRYGVRANDSMLIIDYCCDGLLILNSRRTLDGCFSMLLYMCVGREWFITKHGPRSIRYILFSIYIPPL